MNMIQRPVLRSHTRPKESIPPVRPRIHRCGRRCSRRVWSDLLDEALQHLVPDPTVATICQTRTWLEIFQMDGTVLWTLCEGHDLPYRLLVLCFPNSII